MYSSNPLSSEGAGVSQQTSDEWMKRCWELMSDQSCRPSRLLMSSSSSSSSCLLAAVFSPAGWIMSFRRGLSLKSTLPPLINDWTVDGDKTWAAWLWVQLLSRPISRSKLHLEYWCPQIAGGTNLFFEAASWWSHFPVVIAAGDGRKSNKKKWWWRAAGGAGWIHRLFIPSLWPVFYFMNPLKVTDGDVGLWDHVDTPLPAPRPQSKNFWIYYAESCGANS